jgi:hypothetical protein
MDNKREARRVTEMLVTLHHQLLSAEESYLSGSLMCVLQV